jgi:hypothetical protein
MQEQLSLAKRFVVGVATMAVWADVDVVEEDFPSSTRAKLSRRLTRPSRIAFTSVPSSTRPASNVSRK